MAWRTPAGPLTHEHRLITRVVELLARQSSEIESGQLPDVALLRTALDFVRSYADECHHGKEEAILFKALAEKDMTPELSSTMERLIDDHRRGRQMVGQLAGALERFESGDHSAAQDLATALKGLSELYPVHIYTEDHRFFMPAVEYLSPEEQKRMLADYEAFDASLIHKHYERVVEELTRALTEPAVSR